jgi:hypothetical protein
MQPLPDLINGLKILEPFLGQNGFAFDSFENGKGSGGQFTIATFKNGLKKFIIGYRYSMGKLITYWLCLMKWNRNSEMNYINTCTAATSGALCIRGEKQR